MSITTIWWSCSSLHISSILILIIEHSFSILIKLTILIMSHSHSHSLVLYHDHTLITITSTINVIVNMKVIIRNYIYRCCPYQYDPITSTIIIISIIMLGDGWKEFDDYPDYQSLSSWLATTDIDHHCYHDLYRIIIIAVIIGLSLWFHHHHHHHHCYHLSLLSRFLIPILLLLLLLSFHHQNSNYYQFIIIAAIIILWWPHRDIHFSFFHRVLHFMIVIIVSLITM